MKKRSATFLTAFVLAALPAAADTLAINFSNTTGEPLSNPPLTLGWAFEVNTPVNVTSLSFFDSDQDGLAESHPIGLWNAAGTLLASATVDAGTANPLHDKFRAVPVTPTLLTPGSYRIGALFASGSDPNMFPTFTADFSAAPEITFLRTASAVGPVLAMPAPTFFSMGPAYFGPNFEFQAVPEPSSISLVGVAGLLYGIALRKRWVEQRQRDSW
jgi:hypothetical protein